MFGQRREYKTSADAGIQHSGARRFLRHRAISAAVFTGLKCAAIKFFRLIVRREQADDSSGTGEA